MAAVLSPQTSSSSPSPKSHSRTSPPANPALPSLPPLVTSPPHMKPQRVPSYASKRLSTFSNNSSQHSRSRPQSSVFPVFHSSLSYTLVRDFAYPAFHPLFYGPVADAQSSVSTPGSEAHRRLSDPVPAWDGSKAHWSATAWGPGEQLPSTSYGDGPPWSEDEDLHSPVVTSAKHKKHRSNVVNFDEARGRQREFVDPSRATRTSYTGRNGDGSKTYYISELDEDANGPGGEFITYPSMNGNRIPSISLPNQGSYHRDSQDSHFAATLPQRAYGNPDGPLLANSPGSEDGFFGNESRYSRDYQFTIASPDEEMHGKAVALFDFERENENELPLIEGQVILVSYRHGQGWLVAQDPRTGESGLVPEEYVRLLRDIEGGWNGLMNGSPGADGPDEGVAIDANPDHTPSFASEQKTPTQTDHRRDASGASSQGGGDFYMPVVSTFSTTSKDFLLSPTGTTRRPASAESNAKPQDSNNAR
jgi:hypothetical protein